MLQSKKAREKATRREKATFSGAVTDFRPMLCSDYVNSECSKCCRSVRPRNCALTIKDLSAPVADKFDLAFDGRNALSQWAVIIEGGENRNEDIGAQIKAVEILMNGPFCSQEIRDGIELTLIELKNIQTYRELPPKIRAVSNLCWLPGTSKEAQSEKAYHVLHHLGFVTSGLENEPAREIWERWGKAYSSCFFDKNRF